MIMEAIMLIKEMIKTIFHLQDGYLGCPHGDQDAFGSSPPPPSSPSEMLQKGGGQKSPEKDELYLDR